MQVPEQETCCGGVLLPAQPFLHSRHPRPLPLGGLQSHYCKIMDPCTHHDLKLSPMRLRGSGYFRKIKMIHGHRAVCVRVCRKCGCTSVNGGLFRDRSARAPAEHGSPRDVLGWIESHLPKEGLYHGVATDTELKFYGRRRCSEVGLLLPIMGGATNIWKAT